MFNSKSKVHQQLTKSCWVNYTKTGTIYIKGKIYSSSFLLWEERKNTSKVTFYIVSYVFVVVYSTLLNMTIITIYANVKEHRGILRFLNQVAWSVRCKQGMWLFSEKAANCSNTQVFLPQVICIL